MTVPTIWAPAKRALDAGVTELAEIYFAIGKTTAGGLQAESDTDADIRSAGSRELHRNVSLKSRAGQLALGL